METSKLTARERSYIIKEKSLGYVPDSRGLGYAFYHAMFLNRHATAQIDSETGKTDSYGNLLRRCIRTSVNLMLKGLTKDDVICSCTCNHLNSCVPLICSFFLGVKAVALHTSLSIDDITYLLGLIRPRIAFVGTDAVESIKTAIDRIDIACEIVVFGSTEVHTEFDELLEPSEGECTFTPLPIADVRETAIIIFSSGTTGLSKGICLSHYALMIQIVNTATYCNLGNQFYLSNYFKRKGENGLMVTLAFTTYFWISAVIRLGCSILTGITQIICRTFDPITTWHTIEKHHVQVLMCTSTQAIALYKTGKPERVEGKALRLLITIGTPLTKTNVNVLRKILPRCFISNSFGQTEGGGPIFMFDVTKPGDIRDCYERPNSCGKLSPGVALKIVDPCNNKILGVNQAGELRYKCDTLMNGYYKRDSTYSFDTNGWFKTGDICLYDEKHRVYALCRVDEVFKYRNCHIIPSIIETVMKEHPAVKDAVVIGIPHQGMNIGEVPMGVVSLNKGMKNKVTDKEIKDFVNANVTNKQKLRAGLKIVKDIPLSGTGKHKTYQVKNMILNEHL